MRTTTRPRATIAGPALILLALFLLALFTACGSSSSTSAASTVSAAATTAATAASGATTANSAATTGPAAPATGQYPVVIQTADGPVTIPSAPRAVVSMSPTATEMLYAIGAGSQVKAVDSLSNYPPEAPKTDLSSFQPSLEAIAAQEPDLVVLGFGNADVQSGLAKLDVPVLLLPAATSLDDTYSQITELGQATGHSDQATTVNSGIQTGIRQIVSQHPPQAGHPVRVYHELDDTFYSASSGSFIGQLYKLLGFDNVADAADPDGSIQYPQLQAEQIIKADPTMIVITDAYGYGPAEVAARPGWNTLTAVTDDDVVEVNDDIASRWGPRVVDFLRIIADASAKASQ